MKRYATLLSAVVLIASCWLLISLPVEGTLKYKKDTGKKCLFCHSGIPQPNDEDPQLNEEGKKFKENGYQLTKEQQELPPESVARESHDR
ncbi:MAG: hypothetical protein JSU96_17055 [Acidobacteriota bacterium]|nr:MAG: hypothetical protein JSU96_17055 [Acidobacteriota bacterium]